MIQNWWTHIACVQATLIIGEALQPSTGGRKPRKTPRSYRSSRSSWSSWSFRSSWSSEPEEEKSGPCQLVGNPRHQGADQICCLPRRRLTKVESTICHDLRILWRTQICRPGEGRRPAGESNLQRRPQRAHSGELRIGKLIKLNLNHH